MVTRLALHGNQTLAHGGKQEVPEVNGKAKVKVRLTTTPKSPYAPAAWRSGPVGPRKCFAGKCLCVGNHYANRIA